MSVHTLIPLSCVSVHIIRGFRGLPQRCEVAGERYFALLAILMHAHFVLYKNKMSAPLIAKLSSAIINSLKLQGLVLMA